MSMSLLRNALAVALLFVGHARLAGEAEAAKTFKPSALRLNMLRHAAQSVALHKSHGRKTHSGKRTPQLVGNKFPAPPTSLAIFADRCKCEFVGLCTCEASVQFMKCIAAACQEGTCDCADLAFRNACDQMAGECPSSGLQCTSKTATCLSNPVVKTGSPEEIKDAEDSLRKLKEQKCRLEEAVEGGWVNADNRLKDLLPQIQAGLDSLEDMDVTDMPSMNCSEPFRADKESMAEPSFAAGGSSWAGLPVMLALLFAARPF